MSILVTGAAGFIGSHLVDELLKDPYNVVIGVDNMSNGNIENLKLANENERFTFIEGCASNFFDRDRGDIHTVYHLAAIGSVPKSFEYPMKYFWHNVVVTNTLFQKAQEYGVKQFIFASSSSVLGSLNDNFPLSPYGLTKKLCEDIIFRPFTDPKMKTVSVRFYNVFGTRQKNSGALFPAIRDSILNDKELLIHGSGSQVRNFTYVKPLVITLSRPEIFKHSKVAIFDDDERSILNVVSSIMSETKKPLKLRFVEQRKGEVGSVDNGGVMNYYNELLGTHNTGFKSHLKDWLKEEGLIND